MKNINELTGMLVIFLIIVFLYYKYKEGPIIYVLTRSGSREGCFKKLRHSLEKQTYTNWKHIISNDNPNNTYLNSYPDVIDVTKEIKNDDCPYNLYLNNLIDFCEDGWIIILDDDAQFIDDDFLKKLAINCTHENQIIIYDIYYGNDKNIWSVNKDTVREEGCDMSSFAFHSSYSVRFTSHCGGDREFIKTAAVDSGYELKKINNLGIWANYNNQSHGENITC